MRTLSLALILIFTTGLVFAQNQAEVLKVKARIGFINAEDKFEKYRFIENGKKVVLVGKKNIQLWDVESAKLLSNVSYDPHVFSRAGKLEAFVSLGIRLLLRWATIEVDPQGKWFAAIEEGQNDQRKAVVRNLQTGEVLTHLELPDFPISELVFDGRKLIVFGKKGKQTKLAFWDRESLEPLGSVVVEEYKWHQELEDNDRVLIGSGDQKLNWTGVVTRQGSRLSLWNIGTGQVEREFTASNLIPRDYFHEITVSHDERFILAKRDRRIFIWELAGNGAPKYEIAAVNPKEKAELVKILEKKMAVVRVNGENQVYQFGGQGKVLRQIPVGKPDFIGTIKDNRFIGFAGDDEISLIDLEGDQDLIIKIKPATEKENVYVDRFVIDGKYLAVIKHQRTDKSIKTEFYDTQTGALAFEVPFGLGDEINLTSDRRYLFTETLGRFSVWDFVENRSYVFELKTYTTSCEYGDSSCVTETGNSEHATLFQNGKAVLKFSNKKTSVIDLQTGKELQNVFDPEKVEYDKQNKIKYTGISTIEFLPDQKYLITSSDLTYDGWQASLENWRYCYNCRTISLWELTNQ